MGDFAWAIDNWFTLLQSVGIIGGLLFTAISLRLDARTRRVGNLMRITQNHREIWSQLYDRPELSRVLDPDADLGHEPITRQEEWFVRFLILHLNSVYHAERDNMLSILEGLPEDIRWFFSLPLPRKVWATVRLLQDAEFVGFVEDCIDGSSKHHAAGLAKPGQKSTGSV